MSKIVRIRKIIVPRMNVQKIADEFGCSKVTVYNALSYRTKSYISCQIREAAKKRYEGRRIYEHEFQDD